MRVRVRMRSAHSTGSTLGPRRLLAAGRWSSFCGSPVPQAAERQRDWRTRVGVAWWVGTRFDVGHLLLRTRHAALQIRRDEFLFANYENFSIRPFAFLFFSFSRRPPISVSHCETELGEPVGLLRK